MIADAAITLGGRAFGIGPFWVFVTVIAAAFVWVYAAKEQAGVELCVA
jgi:hypothetical protein